MGTPSSQSNGPNSQELYSQGSGTTSSDPFINVFATVDPNNTTDINYPVKKRWINFGPLGPKEWVLKNYNTVSGITAANWVLIASGTSTNLSLTGNNPVQVSPQNNNINIVGDGTTVTVTGNNATATLTISLPGGLSAIQKIITDTGAGTPLEGSTINLNSGALIPTATTPNAIQVTATDTTHGLVSLQRAGSNPATATANNFGVAQFDSNQFTVTSGYVQLLNAPSSTAYVQVQHIGGAHPSPYTAAATDYYISVDTTQTSPGTVTILLPNAPTAFKQFIIKDRTGAASTNNIFVTTVGGAVLIDGETTYTIAGNYGSIQLLFNGTSYEVF